jgi:peptide-methionine (S)-S-oxide reductase
VSPILRIVAAVALAGWLPAVAAAAPPAATTPAAPAAPGKEAAMPAPSTPRLEAAVLGAGCFWCVEAVFQRIDGVVSVMPGYAGGGVADPTYEQVCTGTTGHAEVARIEFDPARVSFARILDVFWRSHDPTTLNRQGADTGTQYRSAIFTAGAEQAREAEESKRRAQAQFDATIVTEIAPLKAFYPAEDYHRDYFDRNRGAPYCQFVIAPKLKKLGLDKKAAVTDR